MKRHQKYGTRKYMLIVSKDNYEYRLMLETNKGDK